MAKVLSFFKREPVFIISLLAAIISCFFVLPDEEYIGYIDFRTLALLYALMVVVAGLGKAGVFTSMAQSLCLKARSIRSIGVILVCLCFFSAMLITNDVALLTFVPFSVIVLGMANRKQDLIRIVVLQTVAANLGSMLTPVGNPQNLYLYSYYDLSFLDFLVMTLPVWILSLVLILISCLFLPKAGLSSFPEKDQTINKKGLWINLILFLVCLLTVMRILSWPIMLLIVVIVLLIFDRQLLIKADFILLLTFVAFFIFAGNLARIDVINNLLQSILSGREYWTTLAASQVISNVPAALLLSSFTENARALILGVNIGGLGTPIASLASLISLKLYTQTENSRLGKYVLEFVIISVILLTLLSAFQVAIS